ncbi:MAG: NPCBM/NEW2 domain-containing protein [Dehalococcoidia bacterium]
MGDGDAHARRDAQRRNELRLVVTNGGDNINYDHADWAIPRITCCWPGAALRR